jgi:hypothetical protein
VPRVLDHDGLESAKPDLQSEFKKPGRTAGGPGGPSTSATPGHDQSPAGKPPAPPAATEGTP